MRFWRLIVMSGLWEAGSLWIRRMLISFTVVEENAKYVNAHRLVLSDSIWGNPAVTDVTTVL